MKLGLATQVKMGLRFIIVALLVICFLFALSSASSFEGSFVLAIKLDGVISGAAVELVKEGVDEAHKINAKAVVILLNTPGGLLDATFNIIDIIERSQIPVISFVYPRGAKAWSAGTFILISSHVAAMAPFSIIGSCSPRAYPTGEPIQDQKLINSLKGFIVQKAKMHGRNDAIVAKFVTENLNVDAEEAKKHGVIEVVATTVEKLLDAVNGMEVEVAGGGKLTIRTENAEVHYFEPSIRVRALRIISDPMIAHLLFTLGVFGVSLGFLAAGYEGEIIGGILLILGLIGLGFHVDLLSIILIVLGAIFIFAEIREPGIALFGPAGILCLFIGTLLLLKFNPAKWLISPEWYYFFMIVAVAVTAILIGFSTVVLYKVVKAKRRTPIVLKLIGEVARAVDEIGPGKVGFIKFRGEYWRARSDTVIKPGQKVRIMAKDGPILIVKPEEETATNG